MTRDKALPDGSEGERARSRTVRKKPERQTNPLGEVGWYLQRERVRRGETLIVVGEASGLDPLDLAALEHGDLMRLPKGARVFKVLGAYAEHLGFERDPLIAHYRQAIKDASLNSNERSSVGRVVVWLGDYLNRDGKGRALIGPGLAGAIGAVIVGAGAYYLLVAQDTAVGPRQKPAIATAEKVPGETTGSVKRTETEPAAPSPVVGKPGNPIDERAGIPRRDNQVSAAGSITPEPRPRAEQIPDITVHERPLTETGRDAENVTQRDRDQLAALIEQDIQKAVKSAPGGDEKSGSTLKSATRDGLATTARSSLPDKDTSVGKVYGQSNKDVRVIFTAKEKVWIRVEDNDGTIVFSQTMQAGDSYRAPNKKGLVLVVSNAGALDYSIGGEARGRLGNPGEIVIGLPLDPAQLAKR